MNNQLQNFIAHARQKKMDHATMRMVLLSAGWKEKDIAKAMTEEILDMPVPTPPDVGGAREAFLHLLSFAGMYTLVISVIVLCFQYINRLFPDLATEQYESSEAGLSTIRWSIAAILVSYPLLLWMSRLIHNEILRHPEKVWSGIRRWLTYITLLVTSTALMIDIITLIFNVLEGELSIRFLLKVGTIFILAGLVFLYYFLSLKTDVVAFQKTNKRFLLISAVLVCGVLLWGALLIGSPAAQRDKRFDEQRLTDLRAIRSEIFSIIYEDHTRSVEPNQVPVNPLPTSLQDMLDQAVYSYPDINDPETGSFYEYSVIDSVTFKLCAVFSTVRSEQYDVFWNHPQGYHCYTFNIAERFIY